MRSADTPRTRGTHPTPRPFGTSHEIEPKPVTLREGPHLTSQPPYPSPQLAELDARVRALDHLHQLAALAATGAGDGEFPAPRTRKPDRPGNREDDDASEPASSDAERLVATAADLCARTDELAALDAASLAWDAVADAARSDASDHAATERCATRLREVSASLSARGDDDDDAPGHGPDERRDGPATRVRRARRVARVEARGARFRPDGARVARESRRGGCSRDGGRLDQSGINHGWIDSIANAFLRGGVAFAEVRTRGCARVQTDTKFDSKLAAAG